ncbi:MAG: endonuclease/exonuclease/phosphatase family protein [Hymenobacteraceae bacterium]|nr:endonuclease/exonuclease/phosphatase family protein [Hymenobacteraceae bacterium]MDX5397597.1 endonuclease/exonuclease/phosphatase family protein [Hymenobacteraceae bacterium]MDX5442274.1 endonuclease/exonuclease/phosphatase family protein [Hymenobacteraceae bacterium]MDX5513677.1 endonuclease/exonuclease/phosphatase family protein [Hymenobacteraceae bacterium]
MAQQRKKLSFTGGILQLAAFATQVVLLLTYLSAYVSPASVWVLELLALGYPVILVITLAVALLCYLAGQRIYILTLVLVLLGYNHIRHHLQLTPAHIEPSQTNLPVKVMSYNARLFDLYNWSKKSDTKANMFDMFEAEDPDIICFQEFHTSGKNGNNNLKTLKKKLRASHAHTEYTATLRKNEHWGMATFSAYPIVGKGAIPFNETTNNICIYTDIRINKDTIRVYNIHFQSNRFDKEDYDFLDNPNQKSREDKIAASKNILVRLKRGSIKRAKQVDLVAAHIQQSPYPVVVCGDFNDTPASYTYHQIHQNLKDAFVQSGRGFGNTYSGFNLIPLRIDYILHAPQFSSYNFNTIKKELSDHYPVVTLLDLQPSEAE